MNEIRKNLLKDKMMKNNFEEFSIKGSFYLLQMPLLVH